MKKAFLFLFIISSMSIVSCDTKKDHSEHEGTTGTEDILNDDDDTSGITAETDTLGTNPNK